MWLSQQASGACNASQLPPHRLVLSITNAALQPQLVNITDSTTHQGGHARVVFPTPPELQGCSDEAMDLPGDQRAAPH